ncbi:MAG: ethanolamine utilization protein EutH [Clostridia bacterium]|nr:ethanolamine utilization protein EutH [Clostridia bacterium]
MEIFTYVMIGIAIIAGIDRITGNKIGIGAELEKAVMMMAPLALSMAGILILAPSISHLLQGVAGYFPEFLDFSIIPSLILANDMGGAHLAHELAKNETMGYFNGLVTASMMGATVSFIIPFSIQVTKKENHSDIFFGILCGMITIPTGLVVSGLICGINIIDLILNLIPLLILVLIIGIGILKFEKITIKLFSVLAWFMKAVITAGLIFGIIEYLTGKALIPYMDNLGNAMDIIINIMCIMAGALPMFFFLNKLLSPVLNKFGKKLGVNETSAFGFLTTIGTSVSTYEMMDKMDKKGIVLNAAFSVSASFAFVDHLAFSVSFNEDYILPMIVAKLISGVFAVLLANILYKRREKAKVA